MRENGKNTMINAKIEEMASSIDTNEKSQQLISTLTDYFKGKPEYKNVVIYGSLAEKNIHENSDIDIAVYHADKTLSMENKIDLAFGLQMSTHRNIDIIDLRTAKGLLHYKIFTKGLFITGSKKYFTEQQIRALAFHADLLPQLNQMKKERIKKVINGN